MIYIGQFISSKCLFQVVEAALDAERSALSGEKTKLKALTDDLSAKEKKLKEVTEQLLLTGHQSDHARRMSERHGSLSPTPSQSASQAGDYWLVSCHVKCM